MKNLPESIKWVISILVVLSLPIWLLPAIFVHAIVELTKDFKESFFD